MGVPFVIWTMRRTGGTSFANIISRIGDYHIEHEPFNWERTFGFMTKEFKNNRDNYQKLADNLKEHCFAKKICVKHCYDVVGNTLTRSLVELFAESEYKQFLLLRKNELLRLLSLYTAKQTDVWGKHGSQDIYEKYQSGEAKLEPYDVKDMLNHYNLCKKYSNGIREIAIDCGVNIIELYYEDLYSGDLEEREETLKYICKRLELEVDRVEEKLNDYKWNLMKASQNTSSIYNLIPNLDEIKKAFPDYTLEI